MQAGTERRSTIYIKALTKTTLEGKNTQAIQQKLAPLSIVLEKQNQTYISNAYKQGQPVVQTCKKCSPAHQQQHRPENGVGSCRFCSFQTQPVLSMSWFMNDKVDLVDGWITIILWKSCQKFHIHYLFCVAPSSFWLLQSLQPFCLDIVLKW